MTPRIVTAVVYALLALGAMMLGQRLPLAFAVEGRGPVTVIETPAAPTPMEAALILRAVMRYEPRSVTFIDPLAGGDGEPLLRAKLAEAAVPVTFRPEPPDAVEGAPKPPPISRLALDQLLLRVERTEQGLPDAELDALFRGRPVYVETEGGTLTPRVATRVIPSRHVGWPGWLGALLVASLPWWRVGGLNRFLVATAVASGWVLGVIGLQAQWNLVIPFAFTPLLPLLALMPVESQKSQRGE